MKFANTALAAVSLLSSAGLTTAAAPHVVQVRAEDLKVKRVGGAHFKVSQIHNDFFSQHGKGPRALGKVYQKYGKECPVRLRHVLAKIFKDLHIDMPEYLRGDKYATTDDDDDDDEPDDQGI